MPTEESLKRLKMPEQPATIMSQGYNDKVSDSPNSIPRQELVSDEYVQKQKLLMAT